MRDSGIAGSTRLKIRDHVDALAFDAAVTHRLFIYDRDREKGFAKYQAYQVMKMYAGDTSDDD